jgi:hypothetical protein
VAHRKRRVYVRDRLGRFAPTGRAVAGTAAGAAIGGALGSKAARRRVKPGSVKFSHSRSHVALSGSYAVAGHKIDAAASVKITPPIGSKDATKAAGCDPSPGYGPPAQDSHAVSRHATQGQSRN